MIRFFSLFLSFVLSGVAAAAEAPPKPPCEDFPWPMAKELAAFAATSTQAASGSTLSTWPDTAITLALKPLAEAALPMTPGKAPPDPSKASAGWLVLPAPVAGTYEVTVAGRDWVDVFQDGKEVASVAHGSDPSCQTFHKSVRFNLAASPVTLQLSGDAADTVTFTIFPGQ